MRKRINNKNVKLRKDEAGYALVWVLIVVIVAALLLVPLLLLVTTGKTSSHLHEQRMLRFYAADAGIEDGIWKLVHDQLPEGEYEYELLNPVNGMQVQVTATSGEVSMRAFFAELLEISPGLLQMNLPHSEWTVLYTVVDENTYSLEIKYEGTAQQKKIDGLGAWFWGDYEYVPDSAQGITDEYPHIDEFYTKKYGGGTAFIWEWTGGNRPEFQQGETKWQYFDFTPAVPPYPHVGWVLAGSFDIAISWIGNIEKMGYIEAVATDPDTGKSTTVTSYVYGEEDDVVILSYDID